VATDLPIVLPPLDAILGRPRSQAEDALQAAGWRPYATPIALDPARRRLLQLDLGDADLALVRGDALDAVARLEADRRAIVTHLEVIAAAPAPAPDVAAALLVEPGPPLEQGGDAARTYTWGPESGLGATIAGEPVRLWVCEERAAPDRLWLVATLVRRA
jgi:hypothetical protein